MMKLRGKLAVKCAKAVSTVIRKLGKSSGNTLPGYIARIIEPEILHIMANMVRKKIIVTMGTNGKTTVNSLICHGLRAEGKKVLMNQTGANMLNGVISAFVLSADRKGRLDADYACIEVDEFAAVQILEKLQPDCILLTNIFRDQIDRFGEIDIVCDKIRAAVSGVPKAKLIINGDDSLSYALSLQCGNAVTTYGINEQVFDAASSSEVRESIFCRFCGEKLEYDFYHYGQLGSYHCPRCGFQRPTPNYIARNIDYGGGSGYSFTMDGIQIDSQAEAPYNVYNTLSAYAALKVMNVPVDRFKEAASSFDYGNNREGTFCINGAKVHLFLAKNPVGFQQKIALLLKDTRPKDVVIQINDSPQDGKDVSWLWDVDFQYFKEIHAASITAAGSRKLDMALRLKYEDIPCGYAPDMQNIVEKLSVSGTGNLYIIVNYSGLLAANHMLHEMEHFKGARQ